MDDRQRNTHVRISGDNHSINNLADQFYQRYFSARHTRLSGDVVGSGIGGFLSVPDGTISTAYLFYKKEVAESDGNEHQFDAG